MNLDQSKAALPISENYFGKMRGRFDEDAARALDRSLNEKAMAAICAMPADDLRKFREWWNDFEKRRSGAPK